MTSERPGGGLAATPLFATLTREEQEQLESSVQRREFTAGQEIYSDGSPPDALFVLMAGEVELLIPRAGGEELLSTRGPSSVFGEMAVLEGQPRMVRARAKTDVEVESVAADGFMELLSSSPRLREALHDLLVSITRDLVRNKDDAGVKVLRAIAAAMRAASVTDTVGRINSRS